MSVVFDHDVVRAGQEAIASCWAPLSFEAAHDDVRRRDRDVVLLAVGAIDGGVTGVEHIARCVCRLR